MTRYVAPACFLASIGVTWLAVAVFYRLRDRRRPVAPVVSLPGPGHVRIVTKGEAS